MYVKALFTGAWESRAHLGSRVAKYPVAADHVTRGRSINDEDPVSVPGHIVSLDLVPAACTLKADPKIHILVWRVHGSIPVKSALRITFLLLSAAQIPPQGAPCEPTALFTQAFSSKLLSETPAVCIPLQQL